MRKLTALFFALALAFTIAQPPRLNAQYVFAGFNKGASGAGTAPVPLQQFQGNITVAGSNSTSGHQALLLYDIDNSGTDITVLAGGGADINSLCSVSWVHSASRQAVGSNSLGELWGAWWCSNIATLASYTFNFSLGSSPTTSNIRRVIVIEISGASAYDATACTTSDVTTMPSVTTTGADLVVAGYASSNSSLAIPTGWDTTLVLDSVTVSGGNAVYHWTSNTGAVLTQQNVFNITGFTNSGNNVFAFSTSVNFAAHTFTIPTGSQVTETHSANATSRIGVSGSNFEEYESSLFSNTAGTFAPTLASNVNGCIFSVKQ